jgi:uncharacterized protein HemX
MREKEFLRRLMTMAEEEEQFIEEALHRRIATRAHELYEARGCEDGNDIQDWLHAENEILLNTSNELQPKDARSHPPNPRRLQKKSRAMQG